MGLPQAPVPSLLAPEGLVPSPPPAPDSRAASTFPAHTEPHRSPENPFQPTDRGRTPPPPPGTLCLRNCTWEQRLENP